MYVFYLHIRESRRGMPRVERRSCNCMKIRLVNCANDWQGGGGTSYIMIAFLERSRGIDRGALKERKTISR